MINLVKRVLIYVYVCIYVVCDTIYIYILYIYMYKCMYVIKISFYKLKKYLNFILSKL